jgi:esterase
MILHYKRYGNEEQPIICIIHGLFGTLDNWHLIARSLSESFLVYSVDLRNHGNSDHTDVINYDVMANDVVETLGFLSISKCNLIGHSMGGKVVMKLAETHPSLINKMIVVDIAPKKYQPGHKELFKAMFSLDLTSFSNRKDIETFVTPLIPEQSVRLFLLKNIQREKNGGYSWRLNLPVLYRHYDELIDEVIPKWPVGIHVLFMKGELSLHVSDEDETDIQTQFPAAEFATIKDAGHWVHADNPTEFLKEVNEFLS